MTNAFPVPSESVESGLLYSCRSIEQWLELIRFSDDDFTTHRTIFQFFKSHYGQYGSLPSSSLVATRFNWSPPVGEFGYWLQEMKRYSLARQVLEAVQEGYQKISEPSSALNLLLEKLSLIRSEQTTHIQATDSSALKRLELFDARTENIFNAREILGIKTGLKIIDESLIGWIPGSLVVAYARPSVGKTWWLMWQGLHAWISGKTVLAITPEMPANMLNLRFDVLAGNELGYPIDYNKLIVGDPSIRTNYEFITRVIGQSQRWWTYDSIEDHAATVGDILALTRQHNPDVVLIDGISLLKPENRSRPVWEQVRDTMSGLKNLATINNVPIICTSQAVNSNRGRRSEIQTVGRGDDFIMPSLSDAAFGDSIVQFASDVITMCADPNSANITWYSLRKSRERGFRQELPSRMGLATDFGHGKIIDLSEHGYSPEQVGAEARRLLGM